ncbi:hypothetical protein [Dyadobacter sp. CY323]|uniref:hypothetical protein n=1 Tax=Dyadobacter sp. CY323 TaxID=2907302 RepID=UPI001F1C6592|nr:hypothetical protein [Dyadobacter sp. CY323]MCE6990090.1 hypothetical protein [Dyadobacter sp. CY323]
MFAAYHKRKSANEEAYFATRIFIIHQYLFGQGVGINIASPDPSAALDIQSTNKGVLLPKVSLTSITDKTTIVSPATSLLVFNTNNVLPNGTGFYFNAGSEQSPFWKSLSSWTTPFYAAASPTGAAFQIENYDGSPTSIAIKGIGKGYNVGVKAQSTEGNALVVDGKMRIFNNGPNTLQGKVLTSDSEGNATWEGAIAFNAKGVVGNGSEKIGAQKNKVPFSFEEYDRQNNYNNAVQANHSTFTAPVKGIYHFNVLVSWKEYDGEPDENHHTFIYLVMTRNGASGDLIRQQSHLPGGNSGKISADVLLEAGDQISVHFKQLGYDYLNLRTGNEDAFFNGRLVIKL